jgi:hypothetical protein
MKLESLPALNEIPHIAFNLGGGYNAEGQKSAAALVAPGLVLFVDIARGLDYFFAVDLNIWAIREAYLNNRSVFVPYVDGYYELRNELEEYAKSAPAA